MSLLFISDEAASARRAEREEAWWRERSLPQVPEGFPISEDEVGRMVDGLDQFTSVVRSYASGSIDTEEFCRRFDEDDWWRPPTTQPFGHRQDCVCSECNARRVVGSWMAKRPDLLAGTAAAIAEYNARLDAGLPVDKDEYDSAVADYSDAVGLGEFREAAAPLPPLPASSDDAFYLYEKRGALFYLKREAVAQIISGRPGDPVTFVLTDGTRLHGSYRGTA